MVSTPEGLTYKGPSSPDQSEPAKYPSARKPIRQFSDILDIKQKLPSTGYVLLNKNANQPEQEMHRGQ